MRVKCVCELFLKRRLLLSLLFFLCALAASAQPGGGGDPGHGKPVPLSGIEWLLAGGALLGARRLVRSWKKQ